MANWGSATEPEADRPHGPFTEPGWVENYQWLAMDAHGVGVIGHFGTHPADSGLWHALAAVSLPDGRVFVSKTVGRAPDVASAGSALTHARCLEPFARWALRAEGGFQETTFAELGGGRLRDRPTASVAIDLTLDAVGPIWDPAGSHHQPEWGSFHHEQPMHAAGTVHVGTEVHPFDGAAYRDHSRGPRDLRNVSHSSWCNGVFPSGRVFCTLQVTNNDGHTENRGATLVDGDYTDAVLTRAPALHDAAHEPLDIDLELRDHMGRQHHIAGRVRGGATWSIVGGSEFCLGAALDEPDAYILPQSIVEWTWDGEVGYGLADRCSRSSRLVALAPNPELTHA